MDETASGLGAIAAEIMANRWTPRREQMTKSQQARKPPHSNTHITEPRQREEPLNEITTKKVQWGSSALKEEKKKMGAKKMSKEVRIEHLYQQKNKSIASF